MTQATHTPGPWQIDGHSDFLDVAYSSGRICMMECGDDQQAPEETEANARLIAAAPELLAALEAMHACHRAFSDSENWTVLDDEARLLAEKAIAKAKGE